MFATIDKSAGVKPLQPRSLRETIVASVSGIAVTALVFQAIYFMLFALE